jgi:hypothetical protein
VNTIIKILGSIGGCSLLLGLWSNYNNFYENIPKYLTREAQNSPLWEKLLGMLLMTLGDSAASIAIALGAIVNSRDIYAIGKSINSEIYGGPIFGVAFGTYLFMAGVVALCFTSYLEKNAAKGAEIANPQTTSPDLSLMIKLMGFLQTFAVVMIPYGAFQNLTFIFKHTPKYLEATPFSKYFIGRVFSAFFITLCDLVAAIFISVGTIIHVNPVTSIGTWINSGIYGSPDYGVALGTKITLIALIFCLLLPEPSKNSANGAK